MRSATDEQSFERRGAFARWLETQLRGGRLTQRALAQRSGLDHSTISRLLRGERIPTLTTLSRLEEAFDAP